MTAIRTRGGIPLYKPCRCVPPWKVGFLGLFGLKTLCPFWSGIGYGFRVNYGSVHVSRYLWFQFQMNKNEIEICEFEMHLKNSCFCLRPNLILNDDIISALPRLACSRFSESWGDSPVFSRFIFVFSLSQFSRPKYLGALNRLGLIRQKFCHHY